MKAINILIIILVLPTNVIISQLGINAGGSFSNLASEQASGNTNTGINGGLKYDFKLNPQEPFNPWRISPELYIRQAGSNNFITDFSNINYGNLNLTYLGLNLPLTLMIGGHEGDSDNEFLNFGGILIQGSFLMDYSIASSSNTNNEIFATNSEKFNYGWQFSIHFYQPGFGGIRFGYNNGVNNVSFIDPNNPVFAKNKGLFFNYTTHLGD